MTLSRRFRVLLVGLIITSSVLVTVPRPAAAAAPYYWKWTNIRNMQCTDSSFRFSDDDEYSTASSTTFKVALKITLSDGRTATSTPYYPSAAPANTVGTLTGDSWNSNLVPLSFTIPSNQAYGMNMSLIVTVSGEQVWLESRDFKCSASPRVMTLANGTTTTTGKALGNITKAAPGIAVARTINCQSPFLTKPAGTQLSGTPTSVNPGENWYVNPNPTKDGTGKLWIAVFVRVNTLGYIPASCID